MPRQLTLPAADVEHGKQILLDEARRDDPMHVGRAAVLAPDGARQAEALGVRVVVAWYGPRWRLAHAAGSVATAR